MEEKKSESELLHDMAGKANPSQEEVIKIRKDKAIRFIKEKYHWLAYLLLAGIVYLSIWIRTLPMKINPSTGKPKLWDITTDSWTLGPDLDPFLFLRWSEYIVEHGQLFANDVMRYVPLGFDTRGELLLHPYMMAWFHHIASFFGSESVTYSAIVYPVVMFALTIVAFFFLAREIFLEKLGRARATAIALIASFFLTVIPVFLPRTIAGIPEKESVAFLFMFLAFYFFLVGWKSKKISWQIIGGALAGVSTGAMALIWGGYNYLFITLSAVTFTSFMVGNLDKKKFALLLSFIAASILVMWPFSTRYPLVALLTRNIVVIATIIAVHFVIFETKLKTYVEKSKLSKLPAPFVSLIISGVIMSIFASLIFGWKYIPGRFWAAIQNLISPVGSRLIFTVAENRQPFFVEWVGSFGPFLNNSIPIFFWLFFLGSSYLFYKTVAPLHKKDRIYLTLSYIFLIFAICFSRYTGKGQFNGTSNLSLAFYGAGFVIFILVAGMCYYKYSKRGELEKFKELDFGYLILLTFFLLSLVSARGLIRLVMVLAPPSVIMVSYFLVSLLSGGFKSKEETIKITMLGAGVIILIATIFAGWNFYQQSSNEASVYAPSIYTNQWQQAMAWVRDNTPQDAVFGHWWDYGYWLQSIGKRATVLDGGNAVSYWNHLMGRHALTSPNERDALEFLYAHKTTHFLIDSTDIGKYTAFSSIGSDVNYDRRSWMSAFVRDQNQVQETKNATLYVYGGGTSLDEDIIYNENGTRIFLPAGKAGVGAILAELDATGNIVSAPTGVFVSQNQQWRIPLRYAYANGEFKDFGTGIEAGIFLMDKVDQTGGGLNIDKNGALLYLSNRTVKSQLARIYLYKDKNSAFKLVHTEDDLLVAQLKSQNAEIGDIVFFNGVRGPIRIWEINYPQDIALKEEHLSTIYPEELEALR